MDVRHVMALCALLAACGTAQEPMMTMEDAAVPEPMPDAGAPPMMDEGPTKIAGGTFGLLAAGEAQGLALKARPPSTSASSRRTRWRPTSSGPR